jgi:cell pole-organizing protein PopZ
VPVEKPVTAPSYNGAPYNGSPYNGVQYNGAPYNGAQHNGTQHNGAQYNGAHYNGSASAPAAPRMSAPSQPAAPPPSAAKLALDALAQGLAAAASHQMSQQPSPAPGPHRADPYTVPSTGTLVPVVEPDMRQYPDAAQQQRMPAYASYDPHQSVRTLEDAVADMLKPMLQQWLADNMPRIIEKALRVEAASAIKRGHKPPGT